jgi:hypothetical protein
MAAHTTPTQEAAMTFNHVPPVTRTFALNGRLVHVVRWQDAEAKEIATRIVDGQVIPGHAVVVVFANWRRINASITRGTVIGRGVF